MAGPDPAGCPGKRQAAARRRVHRRGFTGGGCCDAEGLPVVTAEARRSLGRLAVFAELGGRQQVCRPPMPGVPQPVTPVTIPVTKETPVPQA